MSGLDDIRVTGVHDGECRHSEVLSACGAEVDVCSGEVVDGGLRQHRVVLDLGADQRGAVLGNNHQFR